MSDDLRTDRAEGDLVGARAGVGVAAPDQPTVVSDSAVVAGAVAQEGGPSLGGGQASLWSDAWAELRRNPFFIIPSLLILVLAVMAIAPQLFTNADPRSCRLGDALQRPTGGLPFGTDIQGCDYYARTIYGARVSMTVGILVTIATVVIAVVLGALSGFYGKWLDGVITRITDIWFAVPTILGGIIVLSVFDQKGVYQVVLVLIILGWPTLLRLMRSSVLQVRELDYVQAARALGAGDMRIIRRHILPNAIAPVIVYGTITVGISIVAEAALSFLGVGLQLPEISWGLMISEAQLRVRNDAYLLFFPAAFLSVAVFSFILLGDALRDALDPKSR